MPTTPFAQSRGRVLHDSAGDELGTTGNPLKASVASGSGGVTEYTEDAASAANPIGSALILRRRDALVTNEVTTEGDNIAANATARGEQVVANIGGAYTDRSIASLAGTSETLMAANTARRLLIVHNIGATAIAVNLTNGAASLTVAGSVLMAAGATLALDQYPPTSAITVIGTATADVTAYEG